MLARVFYRKEGADHVVAKLRFPGLDGLLEQRNHRICVAGIGEADLKPAEGIEAESQCSRDVGFPPRVRHKIFGDSVRSAH